MEGWWTTQAGQPSILFGWPDEEAERNHLEIGIPGVGSWVVAGDANAEVQGARCVRAGGAPAGVDHSGRFA